MTDKQITEEIILNADTYIPIEKKSVMAQEFAKDCVAEVEISLDGDALPTRYQENPKKKSLYGLMTLLDCYLHIAERDENGDITFTSEDFDKWGRASVMNQLDRMKSCKNPEIRNKVYDLLDDYREFYRMLGVEIAALVANKNDPITRFLQYFKQGITTDLVKDALSQLSVSLKEIKDYNEKPKKWASKSATEGE
jgi:hypothetical protein